MEPRPRMLLLIHSWLLTTKQYNEHRKQSFLLSMNLKGHRLHKLESTWVLLN